MKISTDSLGKPLVQGTEEWMQARAGIPTASEFDSLVTPEMKIRTGETPKSYLNKKLAEAWLGGPLIGFSAFSTEQGQILEGEAKPWFELEYGETIQSVGFITTEDGRVGCSPDGLLGENSGIEIKCPEPQTHVGYLLKGELPKDYAAQVHGSLWVTGRTTWKFVSYRRHFPALVLTIVRDEEKMKVLGDALHAFLEQFREGWRKLCEINGGTPNRVKL